MTVVAQYEVQVLVRKFWITRVCCTTAQDAHSAAREHGQNPAVRVVRILPDTLDVESPPESPLLKSWILDWLLGQSGDHPMPPAWRKDLAAVAFSRELIELRGWLGKVEALLGLIQDEQNQQAKAVADPLVSAIFGSPGALLASLEGLPDLASALLCAIDVAEGQQIRSANGSPTLAQQALFKTIAGHLKGGAPLTHRADSNPWAAYCRILERLVKPDGVVGGALLANALVAGAQRFVDTGRKARRRILSLERILERLDDTARQGIFLLELLTINPGDRLASSWCGHLLQRIKQARTLQELVPAGQPQAIQMQWISGLGAKLRCARLPDAEHRALSDHINTLASGPARTGGLREEAGQADTSGSLAVLYEFRNISRRKKLS